ncbi:MAG: asparagine synthase (glutamine-hydrolyzing) [Alphaproteobacteria bacterium]|nr:asparagine synthase (glutamine-hydrolyzing) [Alphaproteobacteria bacterium]
MCGIAGVLAGGDGAPSTTRAMAEALSHRGPDGIRLEQTASAALAHARLSIIDLEGGWQPLHAAGATVVGNGEIYNYVELAEEFGLAGRLSTGSDFEPLLHIYGDLGEAAFDRLRGMYALCLVGADGRTWLARDPFGIKPLYIMEHDGGLAFASEPRAFFKAGLMQPVLDEAAARELLGFNYTLAERTCFQGLRRLVPGEVVEVRSGRIVSGKRKASLPRTPAASGGDEAEMLKGLDAVLEDSVRVHQRSDVPYGLFLSGGVDSAAIATLMARLNERPVTAFTCGFEAPGAKDERAAAEKVARALDLDWRETSFDEADFWRILPEVAWALDDPTTDYAILPTYKLAEAAKGTLTVVLTGEGGDELFGGYGRYRRALRPAWLGGRPAEPRPDDTALMARWRSEARPPPGLTPLQQAQWADVVTWLPADLLLKLDRCLMAHGLEGRTPFLDPQVAAFAFPLPDRFKVRGRYGKWLLRRWLERACPAADPWARKQGFTVPVEAWIGPRAREIGDRITRIDTVRRLRSAEQVKSAFASEGGRWRLLFFAVWSLIHLAGETPRAALEAAVGPL